MTYAEQIYRLFMFVMRSVLTSLATGLAFSSGALWALGFPWWAWVGLGIGSGVANILRGLLNAYFQP